MDIDSANPGPPPEASRSSGITKPPHDQYGGLYYWDPRYEPSRRNASHRGKSPIAHTRDNKHEVPARRLSQGPQLSIFPILRWISSYLYEKRRSSVESDPKPWAHDKTVQEIDTRRSSLKLRYGDEKLFSLGRVCEWRWATLSAIIRGIAQSMPQPQYQSSPVFVLNAFLVGSDLAHAQPVVMIDSSSASYEAALQDAVKRSGALDMGSFRFVVRIGDMRKTRSPDLKNEANEISEPRIRMSMRSQRATREDFV